MDHKTTNVAAKLAAYEFEIAALREYSWKMAVITGCAVVAALAAIALYPAPIVGFTVAAAYWAAMLTLKRRANRQVARAREMRNP